jgi:hypothetical protein
MNGEASSTDETAGMEWNAMSEDQRAYWLRAWAYYEHVLSQLPGLSDRARRITLTPTFAARRVKLYCCCQAAGVRRLAQSSR